MQLCNKVIICHQESALYRFTVFCYDLLLWLGLGVGLHAWAWLLTKHQNVQFSVLWNGPKPR